MTLSIQERIARQIRRAKVDAAIAAAKKPVPDYVFKEPQFPVRKKFTAEERVKAFAEDRVYDDVPTGQQRFDAGKIVGMGDVAKLYANENPREFVIGEPEQPNRGAATFRDISMDALEGPGYSAITGRGKEAESNQVLETPKEAPSPVTPTIKIDLSGAFGAVEKPASVNPEPADDSGENPIGMNDVQKQMLAAMRNQRQKMKF